MSRLGTLGTRVRTGAMALERRAAGTRTRVVDVDGVRVTIDEARPGAPGGTVVLLHGFSADRDVWVRHARHLPDHHVVVPDLVGHGATPFVEGAGYSGAQQAARVLRLLDVLGVERAHLAGNSMGGLVAANVALAAPDRVRSLALLDAIGVTPTTASRAQELIEQGANPFLIDDPAQFPAFYAMTMARPPFLPGFVRLGAAEDYVRRRASLEHMWQDFFMLDLLDDRLGEITAPTWVAWGAKDELVHVSLAKVWADGIPGARTTVYDDLGHMPMLEAPRRTARDHLRLLRDA